MNAPAPPIVIRMPRTLISKPVCDRRERRFFFDFMMTLLQTGAPRRAPRHHR